MSIDYTRVLLANYPNSQWSFNGDHYDGLIWLEDTPKPTQAELEEAWPEVLHQYQHEQVERQRKAAYAVEADPIFFQYQRGDATEQEWLAAVQAVKDRFPYPV